MKINGKTPVKNTDFIVLPRPDEDIVITAEAVLSYDEFDKICPKPVPPTIKRPGDKGEYVDFNDQQYKDRFDDWCTRRSNWFYITALKPSKNLQWDTVDPLDPETWGNWEVEMREAYFSDREMILVSNLCTRVSSMDDVALEAAKTRFISGTKSKEESQSP